MVSPNSVCDDFAREPEALQAQHTGWRCCTDIRFTDICCGLFC
jgi:hypothetical protein